MTDYGIAIVLLNGHLTEDITLVDHTAYCITKDNMPIAFAYNGRVLKLAPCLTAKLNGSLTEQDFKFERLSLVKECYSLNNSNHQEENGSKIRDLERQIDDMDAIAKYLEIDQQQNAQSRKRTYPGYPQNSAIITEDRREQFNMISHI